MSKRTILGLVLFCFCFAALVVWFRQRSYNRYNTGEVTTLDGRTAVPVTPPDPVSATPSKKEPAGHLMSEPEAVAVQPSVPQTAPELVSEKPEAAAPQEAQTAGSGRFQVYRQGDLTWRVDTVSGSTCVLFATDQQWQKPRVLRRACERN